MQILFITLVSTLILSVSACSELSKFIITFYGWPDNDPPSAATSMNCGGRNFIAGGTGTFDDPVSMAARAGRFKNCEIVYSPYLKKYLRAEDTCTSCPGDWVDVWIGSNKMNGGSAVEDCERDLTLEGSPVHIFVIDPPKTLTVDGIHASCLDDIIRTYGDASYSLVSKWSLRRKKHLSPERYSRLL